MAPKGVLVVAALACQAVTAFVPVLPRAGVPACTRAMTQVRGTALFSKKKLEPTTEEDELSEDYTEVDGIIFDGDFEDDSVKPSLTSLLEDVGDETFRLESDDSLFSIPDYVPTELPDLAALGTGLQSKKELMSDFMDGDLDINDQKMFKLLGLDVLDEKKRKVNVDEIPKPAGFLLQEIQTGLLKKYQNHEYDTGSSKVQIAQLTAKVNHLTKHVQQNPKDVASRRGLIKAVNQRRSLLNYMVKKTAVGGKVKAEALAQELGIRFRASDGARSKFEKYRYFTNTKSKKAKNMQIAKEDAVAN